MNKARLNSGKIVKYDFADKNKKSMEEFVSKNLILEYLGKGVIHSIDGVMQNGRRILHFCIIKNKIPQ